MVVNLWVLLLLVDPLLGFSFDLCRPSHLRPGTTGQFHGINSRLTAHNGGVGEERPEADVPQARWQISPHHLRQCGRGHGRASCHQRQLLQQGICKEKLALRRVYLQEGIYDRFVKKLAQHMECWVVGDPFYPRVNQGGQGSI